MTHTFYFILGAGVGGKPTPEPLLSSFPLYCLLMWGLIRLSLFHLGLGSFRLAHFFLSGLVRLGNEQQSKVIYFLRLVYDAIFCGHLNYKTLLLNRVKLNLVQW